MKPKCHKPIINCTTLQLHRKFVPLQVYHSANNMLFVMFFRRRRMVYTKPMICVATKKLWTQICCLLLDYDTCIASEAHIWTHLSFTYNQTFGMGLDTRLNPRVPFVELQNKIKVYSTNGQVMMIPWRVTDALPARCDLCTQLCKW